MIINHIISLKQARLLICKYFRISRILFDDNVDEENE